MLGKEYEGNMTEREVTPRLPTSGQIIGALVTKLRIRNPVLQSRTARRYFSADLEHLVKDTTRAEIIGAFAKALTDSGFIASPEQREDNYELAPALDAMLQWHADHWDLLRSFVRRRMMKVLPSHLPTVWDAYVRLAVIDLALRVAAHLHLAGSSPAALELLNWASVGARGDFLNQKRQQTSLSLEDFAVDVGVDDHTVDAWMYDGTRPSNDNLAKIAEVLADHIEGSDTVSVALELRALYWVSDVAVLLAEHVGAEAVDEAIGHLHRYAEATYRIIDEQFPAENRAAELTVLADLGVGARITKPLLAALIEQEPDDEWRDDLRATGLNWVRRVLSVNLRVHLAGEDILLQETGGRLLEDWGVGNPEAYAHYRRSLEREVQGQLDEAMTELEMAARLDPLVPAYHFALGSLKTDIGIWRRDMALVNEGLDALWVAVAMHPTWILPWTAIGRTLLHTDRPAEAVEHLRGVKPECGGPHSGYHSALGAAYWKLGQLPKALAAFEAAIELDPEETSALVAASEIALWAGDHEKHRKYSRMAHHFGAEYGTDKIMEFLREFRQEELDNDGGAFEHDRKIAVMDAVIRLSPDDDYAHATRGLAHFAKGNDDLAIADYDATLRLRPEDLFAYRFRGDAYLAKGDYDQAIADFTSSLKTSPHDEIAYRSRGKAHLFKEQFELALADFEAAVRADPNSGVATYARGLTRQLLGDDDGAEKDFQRARELGYDDSDDRPE